VKKILFILLISSSVLTKAQVIDSIKYFMSKSKPKLFFEFNNRGSFVQNRTAAVSAFLVGASYSKRVKFALTGGKVTSKVYKNIITSSGNTSLGILQMWFGGIHFEYSYFKTNHWEISLPISLSLSFSNYSFTDENKTKITDTNPGITYEALTTVIYKPFYLVGFGGGVGYRLSYFDDIYLTKSFTSIIYKVGFKIYIGELINKLKKGHPL
jgi:hypothetical protein